MSRSKRNDDDVAASRANFPRANNGIRRIVSALHYDIGLQDLHELERRVLLECRDGVDCFERGEDVCTLRFGPNGSIGAFESLYRRVAVDADYEHIAARACADDHVHVSGME